MCTSAGLPQSANNFINFYPVNHSWTKDYSSNYPHIKNYKHYDIQVHHTVILPGSRLKAVLTHSEQTEQKLVAFFPCIVQKFTILQFFFYKIFSESLETSRCKRSESRPNNDGAEREIDNM